MHSHKVQIRAGGTRDIRRWSTPRITGHTLWAYPPLPPGRGTLEVPSSKSTSSKSYESKRQALLPAHSKGTYAVAIHPALPPRETWNLKLETRSQALPNVERRTLISQRSTANAHQPTLNCQRSTANAQQPTLNSQRSTANAQQPTLNSQRSTLITAPCPLPPSSFILHPSPFTLHPSPFTLHPSPFTLHPSPFTLHPSPFTLHPSPLPLPQTRAQTRA